jgi:hypothetical protein
MPAGYGAWRHVRYLFRSLVFYYELGYVAHLQGQDPQVLTGFTAQSPEGA